MRSPLVHYAKAQLKSAATKAHNYLQKLMGEPLVPTIGAPCGKPVMPVIVVFGGFGLILYCTCTVLRDLLDRFD